MTDENKVASNLTNAVVGLIFIFLIFMNIVLALSINGNWFGKKIPTKPPDLLPADYFDVIEPWGETTFISGKNIEGDPVYAIDETGIDLSTCTWFTYQNLLNIDKPPSLKNAIQDYENGFSHLSPPQQCINSDQIVFRRAKRICDGNGTAECIGTDGSFFQKNRTEIFNYPCSKDLPLCSGSIGSLSFNFSLNDSGSFSLIDSKTRVMTVETIYVSPDRLASLDSKQVNQFYTRQGQLFTTSDVYTDLEDDQYYPVITYQGKQENNFKQTISLNRYIYNGTSYTPYDNGPYGEIIFRPGNLYLDAEINNTSNQIDQFTPETEVSSFESQYRDQFKIRKMFRENSSTPLETTCTGYIVNGTAYISIYRRGKEAFAIGEKINILSDNNSDKPLTITVDTVFDFSIFLVFKPITNDTPSKKWLLIPPLDIGGGKVIPKRDRSSYMRIFNAPLFDSDLYELSKTRPVPGASRNEGDEGLDKAYSGRDPLLEYRDGLYGYITGGGQNLVQRGTKVLNRNILENRPEFDGDIVPDIEQGKVIWWEILESKYKSKTTIFGSRLEERKKLVTGIKYNLDSDTLQGGVYPNNHTEDYLVSVGENFGNVDSTSSPFYTIQPYLAWKESTGGRFNDKTSYKAMLTMFKIDGSPDLVYGNRYLDGVIVWELVNSISQITVPSPLYFFGSSTSGGKISDFEPTNSSDNQKYKQSVVGTLFQVITVGYELTGDNTDILQLSDFTGSFSGLDVKGGNNNGVVTLHFINGVITSSTLEKKGSGYSPGENVSVVIPLESPLQNGPVTVNNLLADSQDITYTYIAIPQDQNSNTFFNINNSDSGLVIKNGFILEDNMVSISESGQLSVSEPFENSIREGGSGYTIDREDQTKNIVYIDQIDQSGNSTIVGSDRVPESFFSIRITRLDEDIVKVKTKSLMDPVIETNTPGYIEYNFYMEPEHEKVYGKSPPQIGFIDDPSVTSFIKYGGDNEFKNYLFRNAQRPYNSIVGINTLQFERLNYTTSKTSPSLRARDNLVLGKFIPYTTYYSENPLYIEDDDQVRTNYNYAQFIPNSISNIYSRPIQDTVLPSF